MAICVGRDLIRQRTLAKRTRGGHRDVATSAWSARWPSVGGRVVRTAVGDRYVVEEMRRSGYNFGGEQSGHLIFLDHVTTGDGVAGRRCSVLAVMRREGKPLSELARCFEPVPAGAGQRGGPREAAHRRAARGGAGHRAPRSSRWATRAGCWCATPAPSPRCACWSRGRNERTPESPGARRGEIARRSSGPAEVGPGICGRFRPTCAAPARSQRRPRRDRCARRAAPRTRIRSPAAVLAELAGADQITIHLREDRRHIQERDLRVLRETVTTRLNLEMAATAGDGEDRLRPEAGRGHAGAGAARGAHHRGRPRRGGRARARRAGWSRPCATRRSRSRSSSTRTWTR